mgnify:CR=1 FL=1
MAAVLAMGSAIASAQTADPPSQQDKIEQSTDLEQAAERENEQAALSAELFYEILVGEMAAQEGALTDAQALMMEAARSSNNEKLYRRATELAIQSRSGDRALRNARAWLDAFPDSRDANRAMLRLIHERKPKSLTELAELTGRQVPNLSRTLRMMEGYGLVAIEKNARETQPIALATEFLVVLD